MTRITQAQVKIAEAIDREGAMTVQQIARDYGARLDNARRATNTMLEKKFLADINGYYVLTMLGREEVLKSEAARSLQRARRDEMQKTADLVNSDLFTSAAITSVSVAPKADPLPERSYADEVIEDLFPVATAAVILDIGSLKNFALTVDEAQTLRRSLNNFFGE